jgi:hypothetical protein
LPIFQQAFQRGGSRIFEFKGKNLGRLIGFGPQLSTAPTNFLFEANEQQEKALTAKPESELEPSSPSEPSVEGEINA